MSLVPTGAKVALLAENGQLHELTEQESKNVLERHPALLRHYRKHRATSHTQGRLVVIEPKLIASILKQLGRTGSADSTATPPA